MSVVDRTPHFTLHVAPCLFLLNFSYQNQKNFLGFDANIGGFEVLGWEVKRRSNIKGFPVSSLSE